MANNTVNWANYVGAGFVSAHFTANGVKIGVKWVKIAVNGRILLQMGKNCCKWADFAANGQKLLQIGQTRRSAPTVQILYGK